MGHLSVSPSVVVLIGFYSCFFYNAVSDPSSVPFIVHSAKTPWREQTDYRLQRCWSERSKSPSQDGESTVCEGAAESDIPKVSTVQYSAQFTASRCSKRLK